MTDLRPVKGGARAAGIKDRFLTLDRPATRQGQAGAAGIRDRFLTGAALSDCVLESVRMRLTEVDGGDLVQDGRQDFQQPVDILVGVEAA